MAYTIKTPDDHIILSKGHAALALYVVLEKHGYIPTATLEQYGTPGSRLLGHPERATEYGIEATTGSLGHGFPMAVGLAHANPDQHVTVILGDGEVQEGTTWESALLASALKLKNLTVIIDRNGWQGLGRTENIVPLEDLRGKFESLHFIVRIVDGHDHEQLRNALTRNEDQPLLVIAYTIKGNGVPRLSDTLESHYSRLNDDDLRGAP